MSIEVCEHASVAEKLSAFNKSFPADLAILPYNLATAALKKDLRQHVESDTVRTLLLANKIPYVDIFDEDDQPPYLQQYGYEWFGPTLFVSAGLLLRDPNILSITLGLITNYLYDIFKGGKDGKVSLNVIYQDVDGSCKEVCYSGPVDGLNSIAEIVRELDGK